MRHALHLLVAVGAAFCSVFGAGSVQAQAEKRIALVIGNAAYQAGALATPANDAGLVAQTLQAAGFDVVGARDLDEEALRRSMRDFVDKAAASGPDTVAFVYLAGYGLQLAGENYLAPVDAGHRHGRRGARARSACPTTRGASTRCPSRPGSSSSMRHGPRPSRGPASRSRAGSRWSRRRPVRSSPSMRRRARWDRPSPGPTAPMRRPSWR